MKRVNLLCSSVFVSVAVMLGAASAYAAEVIACLGA
jgi:hypothetical protein